MEYPEYLKYPLDSLQTHFWHLPDTHKSISVGLVKGIIWGKKLKIMITKRFFSLQLLFPQYSFVNILDHRVAKCQGFCGLIRVKIFSGWGKNWEEHAILQNHAVLERFMLHFQPFCVKDRPML